MYGNDGATRRHLPFSSMSSILALTWHTTSISMVIWCPSVLNLGSSILALTPNCTTYIIGWLFLCQFSTVPWVLGEKGVKLLTVGSMWLITNRYATARMGCAGQFHTIPVGGCWFSSWYPSLILYCFAFCPDHRMSIVDTIRTRLCWMMGSKILYQLLCYLHCLCHLHLGYW